MHTRFSRGEKLFIKSRPTNCGLMRAALDPHRRLCELLPQASKTISFIDETHSLHVLVIRTRLAQEPLLRASIANSNAYTTHLT